MQLDYVIAQRTNGANPFKIFEGLSKLDDSKIYWAIKRMSYAAFLQSAYWFGVSMTAKSRAGMRCQVCNGPNDIEAHHRTYDNHGREHLNMTDIVVLCGNCHGLFHGHSKSVPIIQSPPERVKLKKFTIIPHVEEDLRMPDGEEITLTKDLIDNCRANGAFTNATLRAFGLTRSSITQGWPSRLLGKVMTRSEYEMALKGKFIYKSGRLSP
jgi:5-methylcytosine-specific restriction endonuclease McrA